MVFLTDSVERAARAVETGSAGLRVGVQVVTHHWHSDLAEDFCCQDKGTWSRISKTTGRRQRSTVVEPCSL